MRKHLYPLIPFLLLAVSGLSVHAQTDSLHTAFQPDTLRTCLRRWQWSIGRANVLDTYLTPLEYTGPNLGILHQSERRARWGRGRVLTLGRYRWQGAYTASPTDDGKALDMELSAAGGWAWTAVHTPRWRVAVGGLTELSGGFTYNTRGQNNPAQGRLGLSLSPYLMSEYSFPLMARRATVRMEVDAQLAGVQFAPGYGQSYYEIFSLGHSDGVVHFTHPANCPSAFVQVLAEWPILGAKVVTGWQSDLRQSRLGGLKRHAWRNAFTIGYTREIMIFRKHKAASGRRK